MSNTVKRLALACIAGALFFLMTAAGAQASGFSVIESVRTFLGLSAPPIDSAPTAESSTAPMFFAPRVASVSGNWNNTATWGGQSVPVAGDTVTINSGITVSVTADAACDSLTFTSGATNASNVNINSGVTLDVSGTVTIPRGDSGSDINTMAVGAGTLNAGSIAFTNGGGTNRHQGMTGSYEDTRHLWALFGLAAAVPSMKASSGDE